VKMIDLRSDTVTQPTAAMREAMYRAEVGDDYYGEDSTVNRLQALAAERIGKEAALFVASGQMGNLVSILAHCQPGDGVLMGDESHIYRVEVEAAATFGGIQVRAVPNEPDGTLKPVSLEAAIPGPYVRFPRPKLLLLENTHNRCAGSALTPAQMDSICAVARGRGLSIHLDGARVFNAAVSLGVDVKELTRNADSVMFCLSKGLSAPVGSLLAGSEKFIRRARDKRQMVGGGMRQAGVLAAAGIVALTEMVDRLAEDHANARLLAEGLAEIEGLEVDLRSIQTNIVIFALVAEHITPAELVAGLETEGVRLLAIAPPLLRVVTHHGVERAGIEMAVDAFRRVMEAKD